MNLQSRVFLCNFAEMRVRWILLIGGIPLWLLLVWCSHPGSGPSRNLEQDREQGRLFRNISGDSVGYVGKEVCRSCHAEIYDSYMETGMGRSWGLAPQHSKAEWNGPSTVIYDKHKDLHYRSFKNDAGLFIHEFRLGEKGDTVYSRLEKVDMVVGSGQHTNSHIMIRNGQMCQMPMTFYTQEGRWDLPPGFENGNNARFSRPIEAECINCHNAHPTQNFQGAHHYWSVPQGIDCERCHGPGELHVREKRSGRIIDTSQGPDYSIVNPKRLSHALQNDLCKRCHLQGNAVLKEGRSFTDYKPGMVLSDVFSVFLPRHQHHEDYFIMASHPDRLAQSPCLKKQPLAMRCISCHNPHRSVQKTAALQYNKECYTCHGGQATAEGNCTAPVSQRKAKQNNCVACHMPKSGSSDIPHVRITDHKIQIPSGNGGFQTLPPQGTLLGLASLNEEKPEPLTMAKAWLQYVERFEGEKEGLDSAKAWLNKVPRGARNTAWVEAMVHLCYLKQSPTELDFLMKDYAASMAPPSTPAWTAYRIAELMSMRDRHAEASAYLSQAVRLMPLSSDFQLKMALNDFRLARRQSAIQRLETLLQQDPNYVSAYANLGYLYLMDGHPHKADLCYEKALRLDPDHPQTLLNAIGLQLHLRKPMEASRLIQRMLKRYPKDPRALALQNQLKALTP